MLLRTNILRCLTTILQTLNEPLANYLIFYYDRKKPGVYFSESNNYENAQPGKLLKAINTVAGFIPVSLQSNRSYFININ